MPPRLTHMEDWKIDREQLAWAAGFAEGEGSFYVSHQQDKHPRPVFEVGQINPDPLVRFKVATGFGARVTGPYDNKKHPEANAQPVWVFKITGFEDVQALTALLWTWLGPAKRDQAKRALREALNSYGNFVSIS